MGKGRKNNRMFEFADRYRKMQEESARIKVITKQGDKYAELARREEELAVRKREVKLTYDEVKCDMKEAEADFNRAQTLSYKQQARDLLKKLTEEPVNPAAAIEDDDE